MGSKYKSDEVRKEARRLYRSGASMRSIGIHLRVSDRTLRRWVIAENWERLAPITRYSRKDAVAMLQEGKTVKEVNRATGVNPRTLYRWREKLKQ
jgi:transposase-like protein